jgi:transcriptional regulator with XRE-family HTH domain
MNDNTYKNWPAMTDKALAETIGAYVRHHRLQRNDTQGAVAGAAGVSRSTLSLLERGEPVTLGSLLQVLRALDLLQVLNVFEVKPQISPIAYAKMQRSEKQRARRKAKGDDFSTLNEPEW